MDVIDRKIIAKLSSDAKVSMSEIAASCELSTGAVHQRIKKLEDSGVISEYRTIINTDLLGLSTVAFIGIFLEKAGIYKEVVSKLKDISEITECSFTTGNYSLLIKVYCRDNPHLMHILSDKIQVIEGIARTETFICLENPIDRALHIE